MCYHDDVEQFDLLESQKQNTRTKHVRAWFEEPGRYKTGWPRNPPRPLRTEIFYGGAVVGEGSPGLVDCGRKFPLFPKMVASTCQARGVALLFEREAITNMATRVCVLHLIQTLFPAQLTPSSHDRPGLVFLTIPLRIY
jgi:hypothetical protein